MDVFFLPIFLSPLDAEVVSLSLSFLLQISAVSLTAGLKKIYVIYRKCRFVDDL